MSTPAHDDARPDVRVVYAQTPEHIGHVCQIVREYVCTLPEEVRGDLEDELARLPADCAPPAGALLLAQVDGEAAGCCALCACAQADYANAAELRRLYVRPAFRGFGLGRLLCEAALDAAQLAGYRHVLLHVLDEMHAARALYEDLGFVETPPYHHNPPPGSCYLMRSF